MEATTAGGEACTDWGSEEKSEKRQRCGILKQREAGEESNSGPS